MRQIQKGSTPGVLVADGAAFQNAALEFAVTGATSSGYRADLEKFAVYEGDAFHHYGSGLFAKYSYYSDPAVKRQLIAEHHGKCAFCESFIMDTDVGDVEHFRPKAEVTTRHPNNPLIEVSVDDHPGYFWLSASWSNLYLSCKQCNQAFKKNFFDVWPDTPRMTIVDRDRIESHLLLSPAMADADLRRLIRYNPITAEAMPNPEEPYGPVPERAFTLPRIARTIEIVGLNRPRLKEARANHLVKLRALFLLVTNGGGLPPGSAPPSVTDTRPAILDFIVPADTAAADAREALARAVLPSAEFSALALDALIVWSASLPFQLHLTPVALQQANEIRLVLAPQRLHPQVELAETLRAANALSTEAEAGANIEDLDAQYSALLARYKAAMKVMSPVRTRLQQAREQANQERTAYHAIRDGNGLAAAEGEYNTEKGKYSQLLFEAGNDLARVRQPDFNITAANIQHMEAQLATPPLATLIAEDNARWASIVKLEEPLDHHWEILNAIHEDLVDVQEGYRVRGAPRATRGARCEAFIQSLDAAMAWLDTGEALPADLLDQLRPRRPSGFPPGIRA